MKIKFLTLIFYFIICNFSFSKFYDFIFLSIILLIFFISENNESNENKKYLIFSSLLVFLSVPINFYLKNFTIYENFNGFKLPLYETVDANKLTSEIAIVDTIPATSDYEKYIFIFFKENYLHPGQEIKIEYEDSKYNFEKKVKLLDIINLSVDKHLLFNVPNNLNKFEDDIPNLLITEKERIDKYNWSGVAKTNLPGLDKKIIWLSNKNYKLSYIHNIYSQKNILKKKLPKELYEEFKYQSLKEYNIFYSGSHAPEYKTKLPMLYWSDLPEELFYPTKDLIFQKDKNFSRKVEDINFNSIESHKLPFINDYKIWNFSHIDKFIFRATNYPNQKAKIPYFTSYKFNKYHVGSKLCWQGYMYKKNEQQYNKYFSKDKTCLKLNQDNIKNLIYFSNIDSSNQLQIKFYKNFNHKVIYSLLLFLKITFLFYVLYFYFKKKKLKKYFFYSIFLSIAYLIIFYVEKDLSLGNYEPLGAWDDGIAHETFSLAMIKNSIHGNWLEVLRGGEDLYDNTMLMRYINFGEKFIFGDTRILHLILALYLPLLIFKFYRVSISFLSTSIFFSIFFFKGVEKIIFPYLRSMGGTYLNAIENLGVVYYEWVHLFAWNYEEGIGFFIVLLGLLISNKNIKHQTLTDTFLIGFIFAFSALFRFNYAPIGAIFLSYFGIRFLYEKKFLNLLFLILGFSFIILYFYHNNYFASQSSIFFEHLSRPWVALPISTYPIALIDLIKFNFGSEQLMLLFNKISEVFYNFNYIFLTISFLFIFQLRFFNKMETFEKLVNLSALLMFLLMFYYMSYERYSFLTWFLIIFSIVNYIDKFFIQNIRFKNKYVKKFIDNTNDIN